MRALIALATEKLERENAELRAALRPFADAGKLLLEYYDVTSFPVLRADLLEARRVYESVDA